MNKLAFLLALAVVAVWVPAGGGRADSPVSLISLGVAGEPNNSSGSPGLSADGRYVVFTSWASDVVPNDTNGREDVFVYDGETGITTRVSIDSAGNEADGSSGGSSGGVISGDGRYVAFSSIAPLTPDDTNGVLDGFVRDVVHGQTILVTRGGDGLPAGGGAGPMSYSGRFVVVGQSDKAVSGEDNGVPDLFVLDRDTDQDSVYDEVGATAETRVTLSSGGAQANAASAWPSMTSDARFVAFSSRASNLVSGDTAMCDDGIKQRNCVDIFVHDRETGITRQVSLNGAGEGGNRDSWVPSISSDGRYVAFYSAATNLVPNDSNEVNDMFLFDMQTGTIERVSVDSSGREGNGPSCSVPGVAFQCSALSADGRFVYFVSDASNLVSDDTNCLADVFVRDRQTGTTARLSVDNGGGQLNGESGSPAASADAPVLAFSSIATDLVPGTGERGINVFVRDLTSDVAPAAPQRNYPRPEAQYVGQWCASPIGDVDCDRDVDSIDALAVLRFVARLGIRPDCLMALGNVTCYWEYPPEAIDSVDALMILKQVARLLLYGLPVCPVDPGPFQ